jgi:hypothetical protein
MSSNSISIIKLKYNKLERWHLRKLKLKPKPRLMHRRWRISTINNYSNHTLSRPLEARFMDY